MARIQIVPLPTIRNGDAERTPFIVVMDQLDLDGERWTDQTLDILKATTGAALVLAHEATIDAPGALEITEEQKSELLAYLTTPASATVDPTAGTESAARFGAIMARPSSVRCGESEEHDAHYGSLFGGVTAGEQEVPRVYCDGRGGEAGR